MFTRRVGQASLRMDLEINPRTGAPLAFEAAERLGRAGELFAIGLGEPRPNGSAPVHLMALTSTDLQVESWSYVKKLEDQDIVTDWFATAGSAASRYMKAGCRTIHLYRLEPHQRLVGSRPDA